MLHQTDQANRQHPRRWIKNRRRTMETYSRSARTGAAQSIYVSVVRIALTAVAGLGGKRFVALARVTIGLDEPLDGLHPIHLPSPLSIIPVVYEHVAIQSLSLTRSP